MALDLEGLGMEEPDTPLADEYPLDYFKAAAGRVRVPALAPTRVAFVTPETRFYTDEHGRGQMEGAETVWVTTEYERTETCWKKVKEEETNDTAQTQHSQTQGNGGGDQVPA